MHINIVTDSLGIMGFLCVFNSSTKLKILITNYCAKSHKFCLITAATAVPLNEAS